MLDKDYGKGRKRRNDPDCLGAELREKVKMFGDKNVCSYIGINSLTLCGLSAARFGKDCS